MVVPCTNTSYVTELSNLLTPRLQTIIKVNKHSVKCKIYSTLSAESIAFHHGSPGNIKLQDFTGLSRLGIAVSDIRLDRHSEWGIFICCCNIQLEGWWRSWAWTVMIVHKEDKEVIPNRAITFLDTWKKDHDADVSSSKLQTESKLPQTLQPCYQCTPITPPFLRDVVSDETLRF